MHELQMNLRLLSWLGSVGGFVAVAVEPAAVDFAAETQVSSDIRLTQSAVTWTDSAGLWQWSVTALGATSGVDYQPAPEDIFGYATSLLEGRIAGSVQARYAVTPRLTALGGVNAYAGYADYQSIWINQFYQQSFAGLPGLEEPEPGGVNGSLGFRWEYQAATGFVESSVTRAHDVIAPGYDEVIDPDLGLVAVTPLRSQLNTVGWSVKFENVLTPRLRSQLEFRLATQTEAGLRLSGVAALNYAVAENWVLRGETGYTTEAPEESGTTVTTQFRSGWGSLALNRRLTEHWWLSFSGRGYADNGEIQDSISFSTSAPPVTAWQGSVGVRAVFGSHSFKLSGGPYFVNYGPVDFSTLFFANLYRDRTYGVIQAAYRFEF